MNQNELFKWVAEVIEKNYKKLHTLIKNKKLNYYEIPIVFYCAHSKCNASELATVEILKKGFVNISEFSGGMKEYLKYKN